MTTHVVRVYRSRILCKFLRMELLEMLRQRAHHDDETSGKYHEKRGHSECAAAHGFSWGKNDGEAQYMPGASAGNCAKQPIVTQYHRASSESL